MTLGYYSIPEFLSGNGVHLQKSPHTQEVKGSVIRPAITGAYSSVYPKRAAA